MAKGNSKIVNRMNLIFFFFLLFSAFLISKIFYIQSFEYVSLETIKNIEVESTRGNIIFDGIDLTKLNSLQMIPYRRQIQMIFQDPFASLNPRMPVGDIIAEPLIVHKFGSKAEAIDRVKLFLVLGIPV